MRNAAAGYAQTHRHTHTHIHTHTHTHTRARIQLGQSSVLFLTPLFLPQVSHQGSVHVSELS